MASVLKRQVGERRAEPACPLLVQYEASNKIVPSTCTNIVAGVYVARPPVTNFATINLSSAKVV